MNRPLTLLPAVVLGLLATVSLGCRVAPRDAAVGPDPHAPRIARLEADLVKALVVRGEEGPPAGIQARMEHYGVPGVSAAFVSGGRIAWVRTWGLADRAGERPVTPTTLFPAGELSQMVAAVASLSLASDGRIDPDADVNRYLGAWRVPPHRSRRPVTLRQLLTHSSGLSVAFSPGYLSHEEMPGTVGILRGDGNTKPVELESEPGSGWRYSTGGYTAVQLLVEEATLSSYDAAVRERVFVPLGMQASTYRLPPLTARGPAWSTGYGDEGPVPTRAYPEKAAMGLWTTPSDLARLGASLQKAACGIESSVISSELARQSLVPDRGPYGMGVRVHDSGLYFGLTGSTPGFRSRLTMQLDGDEGLVVMANSDRAEGLLKEIVLTVAREYGWEGLEPMVKRVAVVTRQQIEACAGAYGTWDVPGPVIVEPSGGRLRVTLTWSGEKRYLRPESATRWFDQDNGREVQFEVVGGRSIGFETTGYRFDRLDDPDAPLPPRPPEPLQPPTRLYSVPD